MTVKGVELKSESSFSTSYGVLEFWRKTLRGWIPPPRGPDRVKTEFTISRHLVAYIRDLKQQDAAAKRTMVTSMN